MIDWDALARPSLQGLVRYDPGPSRDALKARHGLGELEPLNWNEDRFEPPQRVLEAAAAEVFNAALYPERLFADFRAGLSRWLGVPAECLTPAHGAQALIASVAQVFIGPGTRVVVPLLTYGLYAAVSAAAGGVVTRVPPKGLAIDLDAVAEAADATGARVVWLCDPNNPTGTLIDPVAWTAFLDRLHPDCIVVSDEPYMDFADPAVRADRPHDVVAGRAVIVIRSFSKIYGLAGLRLGYAVTAPEVARLLDLVQEPFNVNRAALAAGIAAVAEPEFVGATARPGRRGTRDPDRRARGGRAAGPSVALQLRARRARRRRHGRDGGADAPGHPDPRRQRVRPARPCAGDGRA